MIEHTFTCGCVMVEGHRKSKHPSGDYRTVSCKKHRRLSSWIWPHHVDAKCERIPPADELLGVLLAADIALTLGRAE